MVNRFQQQSLIRKVVYAGLILLLFTLSYPLRHSFIFAQANDLSLRPETKGQVELKGSALRLSLTGLRGLAVCTLWLAAQEKKKKHEWNELEKMVALVVKLQPHFISPWLFQSWNISFNVSVECDRLRDRYFYICRGVQLLAEGERRNRGNKKLGIPGNPDLRFHMGLYYQLKIGRSDENLTMRSLYQLSCIRPDDRDPDAEKLNLELPSEGGLRKVNLQKFEQFCVEHPRLIRRLREQLHISSPLKIIEFLRDNRDIPCRFDRSGKLKKNLEDRFPIMPPKTPATGLFKPEDFDEDITDASDADSNYGSTLGDDFDNFVAARSWYLFAREPLPPPDENFGARGWNIDTRQYRLPKMSQYLFRQYPALAQQYVAETLAEEGWFDHQGWEMHQESEEPWFEDPDRKSRKVLARDDRRYSSQAAWEQTFKRFEEYGESTQLLMRYAARDSQLAKRFPHLANRFAEIDRKAKKFGEAYGDQGPTGPLKPEDRTEEMAENYRAAEILQALTHFETITSFASHYFQAEAEMSPEAVQARKDYFDAQNAETLGHDKEALDLYNRWITTWSKVLEKYKWYRFHSSDIQEQTYDRQLDYLRKVQDYYKSFLRPFYVGTAHVFVLPPSPLCGVWPRMPLDLSADCHLDCPLLTESQKNAWIHSKNIYGPFDPEMRNGKPFFDPGVIQTVRDRRFNPRRVSNRPPMRRPPPDPRNRVPAELNPEGP